MLLLRLLLPIAMLALPMAAEGADHGVVLIYHHVSDDGPPSSSISPQQFRRHLDYLTEHDFTVMAAEEMVIRTLQGQPLPERAVAITFDDAYRSVFDHAVPMLVKRGLPFTLFVATEPVDQGWPGFMRWDELRHIERIGGRIGNHGRYHRHLLRRMAGERSQEWLQRVERDFLYARRRLTEELKHPLPLYAYPYGEYNHRIKELILSHGNIAFGQHSGAIGPASDFGALPRFPLFGEYAAMAFFAKRIRSQPLYAEVIRGDKILLQSGNRRPLLRLRLNSGEDSSQLACYLNGKRLSLRSSYHNRIVSMRPDHPLPGGRSKINCTVPVSEQDSYKWFSQLWVISEPDGSWPDE